MKMLELMQETSPADMAIWRAVLAGSERVVAVAVAYSTMPPSDFYLRSLVKTMPADDWRTLPRDIAGYAPVVQRMGLIGYRMVYYRAIRFIHPFALGRAVYLEALDG